MFPAVYPLHGFANNHAQWTGCTNAQLLTTKTQRKAIKERAGHAST